MTGFIDCLAARARPDRSTVRPRPDVLLLAHLQATSRPAAAPIAEDDANAAGGPPARRSVQPTTAPAGTAVPVIAADRPLPRRSAQPPTAPAGTAARLIAADEPTAASAAPARTRDAHTDVDRSGSSSAPPKGIDQRGEHARTTTPPVPTVTPRTVAEPERTATAHAADTAAQADQKRQLTSRPTSGPATQPSTQRGPTAAAATPIPIIGHPKEPRARVDAEQVPSVEITIDRIDVRLENPPPPARSPRAGPRAPMTLERYLESREFPTSRRAQ